MEPPELNGTTIAPNGIISEASPQASAARPRQESELQRACREFEEIFLKMVLKEAHIDRSLTGGKGASPLYGDMIRETLARALSRGGGIGLAETLYRQLSFLEDEPTRGENRATENQSHQSEGME